MKSIFTFLLILIISLYRSISCAEIVTDAGYDILISLLSNNIGAPIEYIDHSDRFAELDAINFNTNKSSTFVIFDFENKQISVGYKLNGKQTKMCIWNSLDYGEIYEAGFLVLDNYKEINSKSKERFAYTISDNNNSLFVDTVAEANSGIKKYISLFSNYLIGTAVSTQAISETSIVTVSTTPLPTATPRATTTPCATATAIRKSTATIYSSEIPKRITTQVEKEVSLYIDHRVYTFLGSLCVLCLIVLCTVIAAKKTEEKVKRFSIPYTKLCSLNSKYSFHMNLPQTLVITHYFNSKQALERANSQELIPIVLYNNNDARRVYTCIKTNRSLYDKYISEYRSADTSDDIIEKSGIKSAKFYRVENKLCNKVMLVPQRSIEIEIHFEYTSPGGRNQYSRVFTQNFESLEYSFSKMNERDRYRIMAQIERSKMTDRLRYEVLTRDGHRCTICGASAADGAKLHVDHIKPVSKGGKTEYNNLRTLCERCNLGKGARYHEGGLN